MSLNWVTYDDQFFKLHERTDKDYIIGILQINEAVQDLNNVEGTYEHYGYKKYFENNYHKMNLLDIDLTDEQEKVAATKGDHKITNGMKLIFNIPLGKLIK